MAAAPERASLRAAVWMAALATACARGPRGDDPRLRYEGRVARVDGAVRMAWPMTALHARFEGDGLTLRLDDNLHESAYTQRDAITVTVDDGPPRRITLRPGTWEYRVAERLGPGAHSVRVAKVTEGEAGTVTVLRVRPLGEGRLLDAAPTPTRRLLVVGDSISAGYGVDGADARCHGGSATNNASRAWPALVAASLGAELHLLAWSGRGLTRNYDPSAVATLPDIASRTIPTQPEPRWDDTRWTPQDIVVNAGTNDVARPGFDDALYANTLESLLGTLQAHAPAARVLVLVGPLLHDDYPTPGSRARQRVRAATDLAVARRVRAGFLRTERMEVDAATEAEGSGCDAHPSAATQRRIATLVTARLR
jgi:lysophospholipase L1-like esterase